MTDSRVGSRVVVSSPEIFRSQVTNGRVFMRRCQGKYFLLRSSFPVMVFEEEQGLSINILDDAHPVRFELPPGSHEFIFKFPPGRGGDPLDGNALNQAQIDYGVATLQGSFTESNMPLPNVNELPGIALANICTLPLTPRTAGSWGVQTYTELGSAWFNDGTASYSEMWLQGFTIDSELGAGTDLAPVAERPFEFLVWKTAQGGKSRRFLFELPLPMFGGADRVGKWNGPLANLYIPVRALFQQWAAETPTIEVEPFGPVTVAAQIDSMRVWGAYLL